MLMMDYSSQYTGSTIGSDTMSESMMMSRQPRIRTIRLVRPTNGTLPPPGLTCRHGPNLGFSLRGGREHGTGFFISNVELGSEAHRQGLRVGDQIIRVNGFTIDDAVHKEVLQLISNHTHLTLKVRSVGMIPVKDKRTDPLSWQIISDCSSSSRSSPQLTEKIHDVRISIMVAPRTKLGCGICKGPEWKPGIFVQFTKEGGIAREAGLRPGDQILFCNQIDFSDIAFNEAVNLMKSSRQLDLIVRKCAGIELFPGESSGYNSSASSVTGDQSPSWSDSKRLSIVKEETMELEDRLSNLDRFKSKKWEKIEWDDTEMEEKPYFKPTIINLSENGTTIKNNGTDDCEKYGDYSCDKTDNNSKIADICLVSHQHEMKTVVVEVHRSDNEEKAKIESKILKTPSTDSFTSTSSSRSSLASSSLSSAICQEILRRNEKNQIQGNKPTIDEQLQMKKIIKNVDNDKQQQHSKLMDEFKKAHRKMFHVNENKKEDISSSKVNPTTSTTAPTSNKDTMDRNSNIEFTKTISERLAGLSLKEAKQQEVSLASNRHNSISGSSITTPPPPPPFPIHKNGNRNETIQVKQPQQNQIKTKPKAPPPPPPIKTGSSAPPPCPSPDYDTISINSTNSSHSNTIQRKALNGFKQNGIIKTSHTYNNDSVEMDSIESFKLNQPMNTNPKPPNTYFKKQPLQSQLSNGSVTSNNSTLKKTRPVSVTIGEYPSGTSRRPPTRFDFLPNGSQDKVDGTIGNESISNQLANELALTLNRSNLKKRTESMENLLNKSQIKSQKNGSVRISVNNNNLGKHLAKSTDDLSSLSSISKALSNRVTINIPSIDRKNDSINGILKNGNNNNNSNNNNISTHRPVVHQKSITFGEMPIVINDLPLRVT